MINTEKVAQAGNQAMKSMCVSPMTCSILSLVSHCCLSAISKITRATNSEVQMLSMAPSKKVMAKPLTCSVPTHEEHGGGDDVGEVGVDDDHADAMEGVADGHAQGRPVVQFFAHALVDQHVVVHRHAHGQGQAGQARQGEGGVDQVIMTATSMTMLSTRAMLATMPAKR